MAGFRALAVGLVLVGVQGRRPRRLNECGESLPTHPHPAPGGCNGGHRVTANVLKGLPELPKTFWTWPIGTPYLDNATVADGLIVDYTRITGGLSPGGMSNPATVRTAVQIIMKADAASKTKRKATIGLNAGCLPGCPRDPTLCNATCEAAGVAKFTATLVNATGNLAAANRELSAHVEIGSVMFDCESWEWSTSGPKASAEFRTQMTRKNELTYNATRRLLPRALIINYAYGAVEWRPDTPTAACVAANTAAAGSKSALAALDLPSGWCVRTAYTFKEHYSKSVPFSVSLYELPEPQLTRDMFTYTAKMAGAHGVAGSAVVPYISLGMGYRRNSSNFASPDQFVQFDNDYRYDLAYSALLGAEMSQPKFEKSSFGPWELATHGVFFTSPFDEGSWGNWASAFTPGSTNTMDHFVAFVKGGAGLEVPSQRHEETVPQKMDDDEVVTAVAAWEFSATLTLPIDTGQALGTFFEITDQAGNVVAHAGGVLSEGTYLNNQNRHFVFHVASSSQTHQRAQSPEWQDLGKPFPESCCETRCASINGSLYVFNRNLPATSKNTATLSADGKSWSRTLPPSWLASGSAVETCGGILTFGDGAISFSGRTIFQLNSTKFGFVPTP